MAVVNKKKNNSALYIAAIGASAGGLESMQKLFSHLPAGLDKMAFVIAQHLSPSYKSMLADTLRPYTQLKIVEAKSSVMVKGNNIYITPPNHEILIRGNKLRLSKPIRTAAARPSVDNLFVSLARDKKTKAIGIVLSGTGTDGALGIRAIKDSGGITFAQERASAKYDSMPLAAVETGKVDYILPPEKMGAELKAIFGPDEALTNPKSSQYAGSYEDIIELLAERTGTDFTNYKHSTLLRRISKRMAVLNITRAEAYLDYVKKKPEETDELFHTVLIGYTGFFRDAEVFRALKKILQSILHAKPDYDPVRIWVIGCATGEEAYSIAISIAILQKESQRSHPVQVIATDINEHSLQMARKGIYAKKSLQHLPADILRNYFTPVNGNYEISKSIRAMVLFSKHDLSNNPPFLKLDLIVCRNLLIYFNNRLQNHVFPVFHSALLPSGYLLLGKSESVGQFSNLFSVVNRTAKIYQRKAATQISKPHYVPFRPSEMVVHETKPLKTIAEMAKETLYRSFEWPYVVVNDSMDIQEIHGDVGKYLGLKPGQMNANLVRLTHKDLKTEIRLLVSKCILDKKEAKGPVKKIEIAGRNHFVKIRALPLAFSERPDDFYLVIFEEIKTVRGEALKKFVPSGKNDARKIAELERELEVVKEDLQSFVERLENTNAEQQSLNEELQAANEELKISNEELETANEELQSANEEINIAYAELKNTSESLAAQEVALRRSEGNIQALLNNTLQSFVLLDEQQRVLALNQVARKTIKNIFDKKIEIGDRFDQLAKEYPGADFADEIARALKGRIVVGEKEIRTVKSRSCHFMVNCTPVLGEDGKVHALSFSLLDITEFKNTQNELLKSKDLINSVFHTADIGIALIDEKARYVKTNAGYNKLFGYEEGDLDEKPYTLIEPPKLRKEALAKFGQYFSGTIKEEEQQAFKKNGEPFYIFRTSSIFESEHDGRYLVITVRDISETKKYQVLLHNTEKISQFAGWEMDVNTGKITCTEEMYPIIGISKAALDKLILKKELDGLYAPESAPLLRKSIVEAIRKGKSCDMEICLGDGTRKKKWVRFICKPVRLRSKTVRLIGSIHDITEQKEAEMELERLSLVASKTNNAVFITDQFGKTVWLNEGVEKMTGRRMEEFIGKAPGDILQGADTDKAAIRRMGTQMKRSLPVTEVIKNYKKDGTPFWMNMDIAPVFRNKKLSGFIGIGVDVTELMHARESEKQKHALEEQQKLFNSMARNFPNGIIGVIDKNYHYAFAGGREIKNLGLTERDFIGNRLFDHLSVQSSTEAVPFIKRAFEGKSVTFEAEIQSETYSVNAAPLTETAENTVNEILIVLYNITKRKKAEKEVRDALKKQKELNELKSKFVTIASHEFRTPLSAILSSIYLISKYSRAHDNEKTQRHIERIEVSVRELTDILNDFLSLAMIDEGKFHNNAADFNVEEFCRSVVDGVTSILKKGQTIIYSHKSGPNIFCLDRQHLKHILANLLSNAAKYSAEGKKIWLSSAISNGNMSFTVRDEGIGIPEEDQSHLFQTFFRANNATNFQGTGMGLHIVKRFLGIMGGTIHFTSKIGEGASFTIEFPVSAH